MGWMHNGEQPAKPLREVPASAVVAPASREATTCGPVRLTTAMDKRTSTSNPISA
jgi:hypothetical protein